MTLSLPVRRRVLSLARLLERLASWLRAYVKRRTPRRSRKVTP